MYLHFLYLIVFLFSVVTARIILPEVISISYEKNLMDIPSGRKLHHNPVPRLGGITFFPIVLMSVMLFNGLCVLWLGARLSVSDTRSFLMMQFFTIGVVMMYLVGTADDLVGVNYRIKFCFQILAAALLPISGLWVHTFYGLFGIYEIPAWFGIPFTIFLTVYITNAINLIDGVDGLASGISILALCLYAAVFIFLNVPVYVTFCLATLGVLLVFFYFNVFAGLGKTRRKIFMGDAGSLTIGYFISFVVVLMSNFHTNRVSVVGGAFFVALAPLVIPLFDVVRVVFARYRDHEPLFQPDNRHIHYKLMRTGLSSHWVMSSLLMLTVYFIGLNVLMSQYCNATLILLADVASWVVMHLIINYYIRRHVAHHPELAEKYKIKKY
jgi:UDP-N-acetylmuramyl pentapeptide phosphotransferase/UDP-N-acetylglucosamine-1-phosphate transferase